MKISHMDVKDLCNETKQNTKQIQILQVDVTKTMERLQTFQKEIKSEFANVYDRFTTIDARLDKMSAIIANSTLVYLPQKISPLPVFDNSYNRLPIPECFPSRLAGFVSLKYRKNCKLYLMNLLNVTNMNKGRNSKSFSLIISSGLSRSRSSTSKIACLRIITLLPVNVDIHKSNSKTQSSQIQTVLYQS